MDLSKFLSVSTTNVYKIDLLGKYGVSATFNVVDLSPFDIDDGWDSRPDPSQEGRMI